MEVILLEKIANLGALGDRVTVRAATGGVLDTSSEAVAATADNIEAFESRRAELEKERPKFCRLQRLGRRPLQHSNSISANAGEEGKLFGSVGARDIAQAAWQTQGWNSIVAKSVFLTDRLEVGEYAIETGLRRSRRH